MSPTNVHETHRRCEGEISIISNALMLPKKSPNFKRTIFARKIDLPSSVRNERFIHYTR